MYDSIGQPFTVHDYVFRGDCYTRDFKMGPVTVTNPAKDKVKVDWQIAHWTIFLRQPWISKYSGIRVENVPAFSRSPHKSWVQTSGILVISPEMFAMAQNRARAVAHVEKHPDHFARLTVDEIRDSIEAMAQHPEFVYE